MMMRRRPEQHETRRYSARTAMALWMVAATFLWLAIGVVVSRLTPSFMGTTGGGSRQLSQVAPGPAGDTAAAGAGLTGESPHRQ